MSAGSWFDLGSLVAGVVLGVVGALGSIKLTGKAPPRGSRLR